jgi:hypothetical protein
MYKEFTIWKNWHRSVLFRPRFHYDLEELSFTFAFDKSCFYKLSGENSDQINKLYGISFGHHHNNSFRMGWNSDGSHITIYAYYYNKGQRISIELGSVAYIKDKIPNKTVCSIFIHRDIDIIDFMIESQSGMRMYKKINFDFSGVPFWGYTLNPYFGGKVACPHEMKITIKQD